jgi:hypothetical protein
MFERNAGRVHSRSRKWRAGLLGGLAALAVSSAALGHKTFLALQQSLWPAGQTVQISMTSALDYPDIQFGFSPDRVAYASAIVGGETIAELTFAQSETSMDVSFRPQSTGMGMLAVTTHARSGEIPPEGVELYFEEIELDAEARSAFQALPGAPALMRSYTKLTKTVFCVDTCEGGEAALVTPLGQALEFVRLVGEPRGFALFRSGEPLAGHRVRVQTADGRHQDAVTDDAGAFFVDETLPGAILLSAIWVELPDHPAGIYHSDQATMTVNLD